MWVNMHVGESYAGQKNTGRTITVGEPIQWVKDMVGEHVFGWTCMRVNMYVGESYMGEQLLWMKDMVGEQLQWVKDMLGEQ